MARRPSTAPWFPDKLVQDVQPNVIFQILITSFKKRGRNRKNDNSKSFIRKGSCSVYNISQLCSSKNDNKDTASLSPNKEVVIEYSLISESLGAFQSVCHSPLQLDKSRTTLLHNSENLHLNRCHGVCLAVWSGPAPRSLKPSMCMQFWLNVPGLHVLLCSRVIKGCRDPQWVINHRGSMGSRQVTQHVGARVKAAGWWRIRQREHDQHFFQPHNQSFSVYHSEICR